MKKLYIFLLFILISCSTTKNQYCISGNTFDISINNSNLSKITTKDILNNIINKSNIKFDKNSNNLINLQISVLRYSSLITQNNTSQIDDIRFTIKYQIIDKEKKIVIDSGKFIIIDGINISDNRFANYTADKYSMENLSKNLSIRLENRIEILLNNKKCKIKEYVAFHSQYN